MLCSYDLLVGDPAKPHFRDRVPDGKWVRRAMQDALLRPNTTYRFSAMMKRAGTDGEVFAELVGHRLAPAGDDRCGSGVGTRRLSPPAPTIPGLCW